MRLPFGRSRTRANDDAAAALHDALIAQIRQPAFYRELGVPDTFEGRFDLLVLHVALLLRRLRSFGPQGQAVAQALVDLLFARLEVAMRELGVSDIAVPKRMKRLAEAFKGRTTAYDAALDRPGGAALSEAVARNVLDGAAPGDRLARYATAVAAAFESADAASLRRSLPTLPDPAVFVEP